MRLIDANVFIYASGAEHEYKAPCLAILRQTQAGALQATTDWEAVQEVLNYYHRRGDTALAVNLVERLITVFGSPFPITKSQILRASRIVSDYPELSARDAIHAAVVLEHRLEGIISADKGFDAIPGVTRFDPRDLQAARNHSRWYA